MNNSPQISVVINTYNAERHLEAVLRSVKDFDEILVCDMQSTDRTVDIARQHGCRIVTFEKKHYTIVEPARQFAIDQARCPWVLVLDADELVSPALKDYLYAHIRRPHCAAGLAIPRKNYFMGRFLHAAYPDYILRFFRKDVTQWPAIIHASPIVKGEVLRLPRHRKELAFEHLANDSVATLCRKTNIYSDNEIEKRRHKHYGLTALLGRPLFRFFRSYILKGGFRDGTPGLIHALWEAIYQFAIVSKCIEARRHLSHREESAGREK